MKLFSTFFMVLIFTFSFCQEKKDDIKKLLDLIDLQENSLTQNLDLLIRDNIPADIRSKTKKEDYDTFIKEIETELNRIASLMINDLINLYDGYYTHTEIIDLIKFYESPLGQKMLSVNSEIMDALAINSTQYIPELDRFIKEKIKRLPQKD